MIPEVQNRILKRIVKTPEDCWMWIGNKGSGNYGYIRYENKVRSAHRLSYEAFVESIPEGLCVLHKCDNTLCVNPNHLFLGTQQDNIRDRENKNRGRRGKHYKDVQ